MKSPQAVPYERFCAPSGVLEAEGAAGFTDARETDRDCINSDSVSRACANRVASKRGLPSSASASLPLHKIKCHKSSAEALLSTIKTSARGQAPIKIYTRSASTRAVTYINNPVNKEKGEST